MIYLIDGSIDGIFTAIFNSYQIKKFPTALYTNNIQLEFSSEVVEVQTNTEKAERVFKKLKTLLYGDELDKIYIALRSNDEAKYTIIFNYLKLTIKQNKCVSKMFSNADVFRFDNLVNRVLLEVHRFKGFIRFEKLDNGVYYAKYFQDNDITTLILPHFIRRYKSMPFILHDLNYNVISAYNNGKSKTIYKTLPPLKSGDEFKKLFKTYYDSVFIKERKNHKLMNNYMPRRYQKYMPEKN
jgi:probable DNA metabolism protein